MEFIDEQLSAYAEKHTTAEPELLQKLNRDTNANVLIPRMLSGHLQGRILSMFSHMIQPKRILEIGTYTGYSALCLAEGLTPDGKLITMDINEELEDRVRRYINDSDYSSQIDFHVGNALEIIPTLEDELDLVFIDADKPNYSNYFDLVIDKLRTGGIIIADNVLWSAKVLDPEQLANDEDTKALHEFNEKMQQDSRVENVLMPVRDGLMVVRKK